MGRGMDRRGRSRAFSWCVLVLACAAFRARAQEVPPAQTVPAAGAPATALADSIVVPASAAAADSHVTPAPPAQRDLPDVLKEWLFHKRIEAELQGRLSPGIAWSILPTFSYNPVYGFAIGASVAGGGKLGMGPQAKPTALSISGNYSTTGQLQAQFKGDIFTPSAKHLIKADVRYLDTTRSTWGLGPLEPGQEEYPMDFQLVRLYGTLLRRVGGVYVGLGYHFDEYSRIVDTRAALGDTTPFMEYSGIGVTRTRASGVSLNLLADTRDDLINPSAGYIVGSSFRDYSRSLGSDANWQEFWGDVRLYPHLPVGSPNVLAFWLYTWMTFGPAPYLDLPANGWDTYGRGARGYIQGRIRGQDQVYAECEYRAQLTPDGLLGAVFFLNMTVTTAGEQRVFGPHNMGGGVGLRVKLNKRSRTNVTLDRGWGAQGSGGWFLGTTEVF